MLPSLISGSTPFKNRFANPAIIISESGVGDFTSLQDALDANPENTVFVIDQITEDITITKNCTLIGTRNPGPLVDNVEPNLIGHIEITDCRVDLIDFLGKTCKINAVAGSPWFRMFNSRLRDNGSKPAALEFQNYGLSNAFIDGNSIIYSTGGNGIEISSTLLTVSLNITPGCDIQGNPNGLLLNDNGGFTPASGRIYGAFMSGGIDAISATAAMNVGAYQCILANGVHANVTLPVGGNNIII